MLGYYPEVIKDIYDIQAVIDGEYPEFKLLNEEYIESVQNNAYLLTMDESRIAQWEELLDIKPSSGASVDNRRDVIIARIRGSKKLNTLAIENIVNALTGGKAKSWVEDSVLYVAITPPGKQYVFKNVEDELKKRTPAHLGLSVFRQFSVWHNLKFEYLTWGDLKADHETWEDVYFHIRQSDISWRELQHIRKTSSQIKTQFNAWRDLYFNYKETL